MRFSSAIHVDLAAGTVRFSADESPMIEVHAEDATIRTKNNQATDAAVTILQPKVLQIDARRGSLNFSLIGKNSACCLKDKSTAFIWTRRIDLTTKPQRVARQASRGARCVTTSWVQEPQSVFPG